MIQKKYEILQYVNDKIKFLITTSINLLKFTKFKDKFPQDNNLPENRPQT